LISNRFGGFWWFWWFGLFLFVLVSFVFFGRAPLGDTLPFPLMSIRFDGCGGFGCFWIIVCGFW
jgi:hypothetical protein